MPPSSSSQKGTGKKAGAGLGAIRGLPPRSRNTTPSAAVMQQQYQQPQASFSAIETAQSETTELRFDLFRNLTYEDVIDPGAASPVIPDSRALDGILARLQKLSDSIDRRLNSCDKGMRITSQMRRTRIGSAERECEDADKERKAKTKKRKATEALGVPPGNSREQRSSPLRDKVKKVERDNDTASSSLSPVTPKEMDERDGKTKEGATLAADGSDGESSDADDPRPKPLGKPQANTFGDDPSTFPDPTVYEILPAKPGMTEDELKELYSVAVYPRSDLSDLIAGDPPDKDFSNAKPSNQINFSTFSSHIEPYFRPFAEEDLAFLRERGDRVAPFVMPKRGKKHYSEIWAEEDGTIMMDSSPPGRDHLPPNQARGSIDMMNDEVGATDKLSVGPVLSRLLGLFRLENRGPPADAGNGDLEITGNTSFDFSFDTGAAAGSNSNPPQVDGGTTNSVIATNGANGMNGVSGTASNPANDQAVTSATFMPESNSETWRRFPQPKLEYSQIDDRIKQELRHIDFFPAPSTDSSNPNSAQSDPSSYPDYDAHYDDEVAARLRLLQSRLREQALLNGARKARLMEAVKERLAFQEFNTILEDLDGQVQSAYLKRTRTMGKKPKKARPGGAAASAAAASSAAAAAAGMARPGIGDVTRTLMERRSRWIEKIGGVFNNEKLGKAPRAADHPASSIFQQEEMGELLKRERLTWDEEVEDE